MASFDFESHADADFVIVDRETSPADEQESGEAVFSDDLEDGELSGWTTHS